jgi:hypothetical protein
MPSSELDKQTLYVVMRKAVHDAIWDIIQKLLTVFITAILVTVGVGFAAQGFRGVPGSGGWLAGSFGVVLAIAGIVYFLKEFDLLPFRS